MFSIDIPTTHPSGWAQLQGMTCQMAHTPPMITPALIGPRAFAIGSDKVNVHPNSSGIAPIKYRTSMIGSSRSGITISMGKELEKAFMLIKDSNKAIGMHAMQNMAAQCLAFRKSKILANICTIPDFLFSFQVKINERMNGTNIIKKLIGNPKGNPETGETIPQI